MKIHHIFLAVSLQFISVLGAPDRITNNKTPPVTIKGNAFFVNDKRFYIRGVDYQPGGVANEIDPLSDVQVCKRDVAKFQKLGINAIRVYSVDNSKAASHDDCMKLLADAGIYVAIDVNRGTYSLNNEYLEATKQSYNDVYLQSVFSTVDAFAKYDNLLLFFSGNEVINNNKTTFVAPYVKAVTRDVRQYIKSMNYRQIPVGYAATDVEENRWQMAQYMNCGADDVRSDFFAFNDYSWCAPSSYQKSGWDKKVEMYRSYDLPIFFSEYGCKEGNGRNFEEVRTLYSSDVTPVYSGGLVYEYTRQGVSDLAAYGLVDINSAGAKELPGFDLLRKALVDTPAPSTDGGAKSGGGRSNCPPFNEILWQVRNNSLPTIPTEAQKFMGKGAWPGPGIKNNPASGSQWKVGTPSTGWTESSAQGGGISSGKPLDKDKKSEGSALARARLWLTSIAIVLVVAV